MEEMTLMQKLLNIQKELKAPKSNFNKFGGFKYRSLEDIVEAVKPINYKYNATLTLNDEPIQVGDRYYMKAVATLEDDNDQIVVRGYAQEPDSKKGMDLSQLSGTASSYARKYALNGLYLIDDTKDPDTDEYKQQTQKKDDFKAITQKKVGEIKTKAKQFADLRGQEEKAVYEALKISDVTNLSESMATKTITTLNKWIEKANG